MGNSKKTDPWERVNSRLNEIEQRVDNAAGSDNELHDDATALLTALRNIVKVASGEQEFYGEHTATVSATTLHNHIARGLNRVGG